MKAFFSRVENAPSVALALLPVCPSISLVETLDCGILVTDIFRSCLTPDTMD